MKINDTVANAIRSEIRPGLLDFGDDDSIKFDKSKIQNNVSKYLQDYKLGDFVYYDSKLKYNNSVGEKVAICVNDDPDNPLFLLLKHPLQNNKYRWANGIKSKLYNEKIVNTDNGYKNTQYILSNYQSELQNTIWSQLKPNEYIPSLSELKIMKDNSKNIKFPIYKYGYWDEYCRFWSSSLGNGAYAQKIALAYNYQYGSEYPQNKTSANFALVFLYIE